MQNGVNTQRINVTSTLKFKGQVRKCKIMNIALALKNMLREKFRLNFQFQVMSVSTDISV